MKVGYDPIRTVEVHGVSKRPTPMPQPIAERTNKVFIWMICEQLFKRVGFNGSDNFEQVWMHLK